MQILPIRSLAKEDVEVFGRDFVNLSLLARDNFPVLDGIVIAYPGNPQKTDFSNEVINFDLSKELHKSKSYLWNGQIYKDQIKLWKALLNFWKLESDSKDIRSQTNFSLSPQVIYFSPKSLPLVIAYFDPLLFQVMIKSEVKIKPSLLSQIDSLVKKADKKLLLPQVYYLSLGKQISLLRISPFTHSLPLEKKNIVSERKTNVLAKPVRKSSAVKVFWQGSSKVSERVDGIIFEDLGGISFDDKILALEALALGFHGPLIYLLSQGVGDDLQGALRLTKAKSLLDSSIGTYLFARNKKGLLNISLAVPKVRSPQEYLMIKKELALKGLVRKGSLKFWLELGVPENLINIKDYLITGVDGVIVDFDSLQQLILGYAPFEREYYKRSDQALLKLFALAIPELQKAKVLILVRSADIFGLSCLEDLVSFGISGVVHQRKADIESLPEHLNFLEKRLVTQRFLS